MLHTHIEMLHTHIEMLHTHIEILHTHIEMLHTHIQILHTHIEISHTHIQIMEYCNVLHAIIDDKCYNLPLSQHSCFMSDIGSLIPASLLHASCKYLCISRCMKNEKKNRIFINGTKMMCNALWIVNISDTNHKTPPSFHRVTLKRLCDTSYDRRKDLGDGWKAGCLNGDEVGKALLAVNCTSDSILALRLLNMACWAFDHLNGL